MGGRRPLKHRTVERMVQVWYNDVMLALYIYICIQNRGGSTSRHPALRRDRFSKYRSVEGKRRCSWNFDENTLRHSLLRSSSSTRCLKTRWIMEFVPNSFDRDIRSQLIEIVYLHTDDFQIFHQISSYINLFRSVKKYWLRWRDAKATIDLLKRFSPVFLPGISVQETNLKASRLE